MRILLISDSHGDDNLVIDVYREEMKDGLAAVLHMGDIGSRHKRIRELIQTRFVVVSGNCDYDSSLPQSEVVEIGGHKIFMTHGHRYLYAGDTTQLEYAALSNKCDIVTFGHTHVPCKLEKEDMLILNPGSIARPRQTGYDKTYMIMNIDDSGKVSVEIKTWK